jgi:putative GTP pyrophosphokinase
MINKLAFFKKYHLNEQIITDSGLDWDNLEKIAEVHRANYIDLERDANYIAQIVRDALEIKDIVHSVKQRVKSPESLIAKIVRKASQKNNPDKKKWLDITPENYLLEICDVVGIRVLHLLQNDWDKLYDFIKSRFEITKAEVYCKIDEKELFESREVDYTQKEKISYRSVHYDARFIKSKDLQFSFEIQTRTISQEAWGEIDHRFRYPIGEANPILTPYLDIHSNLSNILDRMSSYITTLTRYIQERDEEIEKLRYEIEKSNVDKQEKSAMMERLENISSPQFKDPFAQLFLPGLGTILFAQQAKEMNQMLETLSQLPQLPLFNNLAEEVDKIVKESAKVDDTKPDSPI